MEFADAFFLYLFLILVKLHSSLDCSHRRGDFLLDNDVTRWQPITRCIQEKRRGEIKSELPECPIIGFILWNIKLKNAISCETRAQLLRVERLNKTDRLPEGRSVTLEPSRDQTQSLNGWRICFMDVSLHGYNAVSMWRQICQCLRRCELYI